MTISSTGGDGGGFEADEEVGTIDVGFTSLFTADFVGGFIFSVIKSTSIFQFLVRSADGPLSYHTMDNRIGRPTMERNTMASVTAWLPLSPFRMASCIENTKTPAQSDRTPLRLRLSMAGS